MLGMILGVSITALGVALLALATAAAPRRNENRRSSEEPPAHVLFDPQNFRRN